MKKTYTVLLKDVHYSVVDVKALNKKQALVKVRRQLKANNYDTYSTSKIERLYKGYQVVKTVTV